MLTVKVRIIIIVAMIIVLGTIINMIRKRRLELRYALIWLVLGTGIFVLAIFPQIMNRLSNLVGIASPVNMLFFMGFIFSLMIIFVLTVAISRTSIRIKKLAQKLAFCEKELENLKQK